MSSRRGSAVATAETSLEPSRDGSPADTTGEGLDVLTEVDGDESILTTNGVQGQDGDSLSRSVSRSGSVALGSYIQRVPQLDIAFLHAMSSHRPLGPHKHFNLIPILITLDRAARQIGGQARDANGDSGIDDDADEGHRGNGDEEGRTRVKQEEEDDEDETGNAIVATNVAGVDAEMVWQRMEELYDVEGLEELEEQTIDVDDGSPFNKRPSPTFVSLASRKVLGNSVKVPASFGFGSKVEKVMVDADIKKKNEKMKKSSKSKAREEEEAVEEEMTDFELGPWEDYESIIAPRRIKGSAADDEVDEAPSESDGDLSGYSGDVTGKEDSVKEEEGQEVEPLETDEKTEEEEQEEAEGEGEDENEEEEEDEEDEREEEEGQEETEKPSAKRKSASSAKKAPPSSRQKRSSGAGSATPTPAPASLRSSRSSTAKPRRSARR